MSKFIRGVSRKLTLAVVVVGALTAFATASHASHRYRGGYSPSGHSYTRFGGARHHYGGGYGGYRGYGSYRAPFRYHRAPHSYLSFGFSFGYPRYHAPPAYIYGPPHLVYRERVYDDRVYEREDRDSDGHDRDYDRPDPDSDRDDRGYDRSDDSSRRSDELDVENEPPAGAYYRDRFCNRTFSTLDDYTEHLDNEHHSQTIDIIERDSGKRLRTLEFVDGYWQVQQ